MTSMDRWKRVQELFDLLEPLPGDQQMEALKRAEANPEVRSEVLRLFEAIRGEELAQEEALKDQTGRGAPFEPKLDWSDDQPDLKLLSLIGAGGAGTVFRAVRTVHGVEQQVAVKVYHAHRSTAEDQDRFVREQRMLATLTDPGIVRFFDSGLTSDGRPYLVMELAEGAHLTKYCDEQCLDVEARVRLLLLVCRAVAAAHARLIVHLDLKPSNILVTRDGDIKLLDFGTARLIDHSFASVVTQQLTPQYSSPERLRGEAATVSSDVYSLGLILFELCSGGLPFPKEASIVGIAERAGGHTTASGPSAAVTAEAAAVRGTSVEKLRRQLQGDLASICAKALAFDSNRRYLTVTEFADDLRRLLAGEPVAAHAVSFGYLCSKFVVRYWGRLAFAAVFIVGLLGAAFYSWVQARNASVAAQRAEAAQIFLTNVLTSVSAGVGDSSATIPQLLELAESKVAGVRSQDQALASDVELALGMARSATDPLGEASVQRALGLARTSGDISREASALVVMGSRSYLNNRPAEAWKLLQQSLELWNRHRTAFSPARAAWLIGTAATNMTNVRPFDTSVREPLDACLAITAESQRVPQYLRLGCLSPQGVSLMYGSQEYAKALPLHLEIVQLRRSPPVDRYALAQSLQLLGLNYRFLDRHREEEVALRESYRLAVEAHGGESLNAANSQAYWAVALAGIGNVEEGMRQSEAALAIYRKHYPKHAELLLFSPLASAATNACLGGRFVACEAYAREALESLGSNPSQKDRRVQSVEGYLGLALAQLGGERRDAKLLAEAKPLLERNLQMLREENRSTLHKKAMEEALAKLQ
jgi:tRNA A-37 threonylcarbamoyl transferase component Bud32